VVQNDNGRNLGRAPSLLWSNALDNLSLMSKRCPPETILTPGVRPIEGRIETAKGAAGRALELAQRAARAGTFGVGGFLMDKSGQILAEAVNAVIEDGQVCDPTAHVERQLIDWLFSTHGQHARPQELVTVSSLDPCACARAPFSLQG
jgi:Cytidine and deoxycytidylate deaminase zinc-binding region